jgi:hypothetical protein
MKLTSEQRAGLTAWLEKNADAIRELGLEVTEVAMMAAEELRFKISPGHVCHRMGPNRDIKHMWPRSEGMLKSRAGQSAARSEAIVAMLEKMRSELGVSPVDGWEEVLAWATSRSSRGAAGATGLSSPSADATS